MLAQVKDLGEDICCIAMDVSVLQSLSPCIRDFIPHPLLPHVCFQFNSITAFQLFCCNSFRCFLDHPFLRAPALPLARRSVAWQTGHGELAAANVPTPAGQEPRDLADAKHRADGLANRVNSLGLETGMGIAFPATQTQTCILLRLCGEIGCIFHQPTPCAGRNSHNTHCRTWHSFETVILLGDLKIDPAQQKAGRVLSISGCLGFSRFWQVS